MKKVLAFFGKILGVAKGPIVGQIVETAGESLESFAQKKPQAAAALVSSMYVWIDTEAENAAAKTKTDWDDEAVKDVKAELEAFAARHGLQLQNLDSD